jgi:N-methylhydantoinase A/oxoprolinase/acetone carboxylase beta subunit
MSFSGRFYLMLSGGGSASVASARRYPIRLVESGPAAGALAAALYGRLTATDPLLSFDMGGTTAKACVVEGGEPAIVNALEVARAQRFQAGSGLPLIVPSVELLEIGAGGGSIARSDALGLLKVGPDSAGADPGPACYGQGGADPTVTDANVVLGYFSPDYFLGGRMRLDVEAARQAVRRLGATLGMSLEETAWGIHQVVNQNMAQAARAHLIERNQDPRRLALVAFGGAGPAHAAAVARLLGATRVVSPLGAGATSALGCLAAPLSFQFARSLPGTHQALDWERVDALLGDLEERGREALVEAGVPAEQVTVRREVDARVYGQTHELTIRLPDGRLSPEAAGPLFDVFAQAYRRRYSRLDPTAVLELVTWKVTALGPGRPVELHQPANATSTNARKGFRPAYFGERDGYISTPVYDRYQLAPGAQLTGPAIVEEREATFVLPPHTRGAVDAFGSLAVQLEPERNGREGL